MVDQKRRNLQAQPASGALDGAKGDFVVGDFLVDCKSTEKKQFILSRKIWDKIKEDSFSSRKMPTLAVVFENPEEVLYVVDENTFMDLVEGIEEDK